MWLLYYLLVYDHQKLWGFGVLGFWGFDHKVMACWSLFKLLGGRNRCILGFNVKFMHDVHEALKNLNSEKFAI